jgi:hypothetical protein
MSSSVCWQVAVLALFGTSLAVAQSQPGVVVIRGQSPTVEATAPVVYPEAYGPLIGSAPGYGEHKKGNAKKDFKTFPQYHNNHFGYEGGYYAGPEGYYTSHDKVRAYTAGHGGHAHGCPHCNYGNSCPSDGCPHCGFGNKKPKHYTTYQYKWPENMVYPPAVQPAGMIQYPYYTLRGPTDFFMK